MIRCPNCGTDNRPGSKYCKVCGSALPIQQSAPPRVPPSMPPPQTRLPTIQPQSPLPQPYPQPSAPKPATRVPLSTQLQTTFNPAKTFHGVVVDTPSERRDLPPRDTAKLMFIIALLLPILPVLAIILLTVGVVLCAVVLAGAGIVLTCILIPLGLMTGLFNRVRDPYRAEVPILEFRARDATGNIVNIEMIGKRRGGKIALGDEIEAEGEWADGQQTTLRAWQVKILGASSVSGGRMSGTVTTDRPWSMALAKRALVLSLILVALIYGVPLVLNLYPAIKGP